MSTCGYVTYTQAWALQFFCYGDLSQNHKEINITVNIGDYKSCNQGGFPDNDNENSHFLALGPGSSPNLITETTRTLLYKGMVV